jgi:hypothetical protein
MRLTYIGFAVCLLAACGDDSGATPGFDGVRADGSAGGDGSSGDGGGDGGGGGIDGTFSSTDATGGGTCTADPSPPGASSCPGDCTGGCADGVCTIDCRNHNCDGADLVCPQEYACVIDCYGGDNCDSGSVTCPDLYACTLKCAGGTDACGDQNLICGGGSCRMECDGDACVGANIQCGSGPCTAACTSGAAAPTPDCGNSCACAGCP